jgi:hypothetical protein
VAVTRPFDSPGVESENTPTGYQTPPAEGDA